MLQKVTPAEKGIPYAKNFYISNIRATHAKNAFVAAGLDKSILTNFNFSNCVISAEVLGSMEWTGKWSFKNVELKTTQKPVQPAPKTAGKESEERLKG